MPAGGPGRPEHWRPAGVAGRQPPQCRSALHAVPEILDRFEEALALGIIVFRLRLELAQQFLLPRGEVDRCLDSEFDEHVAASAATQGRHALVAQSHLTARLAARRDFHAGASTVDSGHFDVTTKSCGRHRDRNSAEEVDFIPLEKFVLLDLDEDVEIAWRSAAHPGFTLAGKADAGAGFDTGGNVHVEGPILFDPALAAAASTGVLDDLPKARAGGAGTLDSEETLLGAHLAHT